MAERVLINIQVSATPFRDMESKMQNALYDVLDEAGADYSVDQVLITNDQTALPDEDYLGPFTKDSETSRHAALDNYPRSGSQRHKVLVALACSGDYGMTRAELAEELRLPDSGTDARVWELLKGEFIEPTDRTRRTRLGSDAVVLVVADRGWKYIRAKEPGNLFPSNDSGR